MSESPLPTSPVGRRTVLRTISAAAVVGLAGVGVVATSRVAGAASPGTFTVGATPVQLNQPSDPMMGVLTPNADANVKGMFSPQVDWPVIPVQVSLGRNGNLTSWGTPVRQAVQGGTVYDDWTPSSGFAASAHVQTASMNGYNSFCNGPVALSDGRLLMVGGNSTQMTMVYDPVSHQQVMGQNVKTQRWYTTTLRLVDGRILVLGGGNYYNTGAYSNPADNSGVATIPEIGSGTGAWTQLTGAASTMAFGAQDNRWWYPRAFNGPSGTVVGTSGDQVWSLSTAGAGSIAKIATLPYNPKVSGSQVMYAPGKILVAGGGQAANGDPVPATKAAAIVDLTGGAAKASFTGWMAVERNWLNLTVLPNGEVLANGGTKFGAEGDATNSVRVAEIWDPTFGGWRGAAVNQRTRTYHSVSVLLPSGAVFTGGGGVPGPEDNFNAELFYPPYLFTKGADGVVRWASRPTITAISGSATHGGTIALTIGDGRAVKAASLISMSQVTHGLNTDQRRVPLAVTQNGATVSATLPASVNTLPPGDYELTVLDTAGVPSPAQVLTIVAGGPGLVTVSGAAQVQTGGGGAVTPTAPQTTVALDLQTGVGLEAGNYRGYRMQVEGTDVYLRQTDGVATTAATQGSSWVVLRGLANPDGISFESVAQPGWFLTAPKGYDGALSLGKFDGTVDFALRGTWAKANGNTGQNTSFQLWADRAYFIRHTGFRFYSQKFDGSDQARADTTFVVRPSYAAAPSPLAVGRSLGFEAVSLPGYRVLHENGQVYLRQVAVGAAAAGATSWVVRTGLGANDGVSFESVTTPGSYLVAPANGVGAAQLVANDGSAQFKTRATWAPALPNTGRKDAVSFQWYANRAYFLRHVKGVVTSAAYDGSATAKDETTFTLPVGLVPAS